MMSIRWRLAILDWRDHAIGERRDHPVGSTRLSAAAY
jgi:hypothetical protein